MMKDYVIDVLMNIGVPAGIKGFTYICDAIDYLIPIHTILTERYQHSISISLKSITQHHQE